MAVSLIKGCILFIIFSRFKQNSLLTIKFVYCFIIQTTARQKFLSNFLTKLLHFLLLFLRNQNHNQSNFCISKSFYSFFIKSILTFTQMNADNSFYCFFKAEWINITVWVTHKEFSGGIWLSWKYAPITFLFITVNKLSDQTFYLNFTTYFNLLI